jgi:hypothetical protein
MRRITLILAFLFAIAVARRARATADYPDAIASDLSLKSAPACALCHTTGNAGGRGTVKTPFGTSARAHGLIAFDPARLKTVLDAMRADHTDSDHDCVADIDELVQGTDPNTADNPEPCDAGGGPQGPSLEEPRYGCGAHVASTSRSDAAASGALAITIALAFSFRSRGRRRQRG